MLHQVVKISYWTIGAVKWFLEKRIKRIKCHFKKTAKMSLLTELLPLKTIDKCISEHYAPLNFVRESPYSLLPHLICPFPRHSFKCVFVHKAYHWRMVGGKCWPSWEPFWSDGKDCDLCRSLTDQFALTSRPNRGRVRALPAVAQRSAFSDIAYDFHVNMSVSRPKLNMQHKFILLYVFAKATILIVSHKIIRYFSTII